MVNEPEQAPQPDVKLSREEVFERGLACILWVLSVAVLASAVLFVVAAVQTTVANPALAALELLAAVVAALIAILGAAAGAFVWVEGLE